MAEKKQKARLPEIPCYPKLLVYPKNGREISLEQIRAQWPRYSEVEAQPAVDMDMTEVPGVHITEQVPLFPSRVPGRRELAKPCLLETSVDEELERLNREKPLMLSANHPKPAKHIPHEMDDPDRELEQLMLEKKVAANFPASVPHVVDPPAGPPRSTEGGVAVETGRHTSSCPGGNPSSTDDRAGKVAVAPPVAGVTMPTKARAMLNMLADKENAPVASKRDVYGFTPSGVSNPLVTQPCESSLPSIMAKLSFSDASMSHQASVSHSLLLGHQEDRLPASRLDDVSVDWERKAKLAAAEETDLEAQFMQGYTEFETRAAAASSGVQNVRKRKGLKLIKSHEPSFKDCSSVLGGDVSSFEVFEDPSRDASQFSRIVKDDRNIFRQPPRNQQGVCSLGTSEYLPGNANGVGKPGTQGAGERSLNSFSVFEEPSFTNVSKQAQSHSVHHSAMMLDASLGERGASKRRNNEREQCPLEVSERKGGESAHDSLSSAVQRQPELPVHLAGGGGQEATQFDICPASNFEPTSTPCARHKGADVMGVDFSVNFTSISILHPEPCPPSKPDFPDSQPPPATVEEAGVAEPAVAMANVHEVMAPLSMHSNFISHKLLETIPEESRSSYGTTSTCTSSGGSGTSKLATTSNSSVSSTPGEVEPMLGMQELRRFGVRVTGAGHINPFLPETVEFMLYSLPITSTKVRHVSANSSRFVVGGRVELCGVQHHVREKLATGGFASIYVASTDEGMKALKVQSPPHSWEVAILEEAHRLLRANNFQDVTQSIMQVEYAQIFANSSVIVSPYHSFGTLLDLTNKHRVEQKLVKEVVCVYYSLELLRVVQALHSCGILHADIKPDNIMLRDVSKCADYMEARGCGLCLVDFGRAIDTNSFPRGTQFVGSCDTDGFLCPEMKNDEPWTWQADLYGTAASIFVLLAREYMKLAKSPETGEYRPMVSPSRFYDKKYWEKVFIMLLNCKDADHTHHLARVIDHVATKSGLLERSFKTQMDRTWAFYC